MFSKASNIKGNKNFKCPTCKKIVNGPFMPFCSKKCSDIDLLKWLNDDEYKNHTDFKENNQKIH